MYRLVTAFCTISLVLSLPAIASVTSNVIDQDGEPGIPSAGQCPCPANAEPEGEPVCFDGYVDNFNGGCNSTPPVYSTVNCSPICGEMGVYTTNNQALRDTDWYRITVGAGNFSASGIGNGFALQVAVLDTNCPPGLIGNTEAQACVATTPINFAGPGTFTIFASRSNGLNPVGVPPCGSTYTLNISGPGIPSCGVTPVEESTWGAIKAQYDE